MNNAPQQTPNRPSDEPVAIAVPATEQPYKYTLDDVLGVLALFAFGYAGWVLAYLLE